MPPNWRQGLSNAFPVPEDRRPGYKKKKTKPVADGAQNANSKPAAVPDQTLDEALTYLTITTTSTPTTPFRFFDLPSEIRNRIYHHTLFSKPGYRPVSGHAPSRITSLLTSKKMHAEASYILYSNTTFNLFPIQLFEAPPTLVDIHARYLPHIAHLRMIVGPSWTSVPKSWRVTPTLKRALKKLSSLRTLRVFVEFDPSHPAIAKFRISHDFYTNFCGNLLGDVLEVLEGVRYVELDGHGWIDREGPLVKRLRGEVEEANKAVRWGLVSGWKDRQVTPLVE